MIYQTWFVDGLKCRAIGLWLLEASDMVAATMEAKQRVLDAGIEVLPPDCIMALLPGMAPPDVSDSYRQLNFEPKVMGGGSEIVKDVFETTKEVQLPGLGKKNRYLLPSEKSKIKKLLEQREREQLEELKRDYF